MSFKADLCREYRKDNIDMPTKKLARIIYNDNKLLFKDVENARNVLLYIEGKSGNGRNRKSVTNSEFYRQEHRPYNPYKLPESDEESFVPYQIKGHKRVLVINDIHLPYHSLPALTATFDFAKKEKPDAVFINGDVLDFHSISFFERDPRKKNFAQELDMFKEFFIKLQKIFKCKIYLKCGNHEERYEHFLFQKAKELVGVDEFDLENIIKARAEGIEVIKDKRIVLINDLPFVHGHEMGRGVFNPVNAARGLFLQAKHSCVKGDCHTTSEHTEMDIMGKMMTTWSVGALCGLSPKWLPINRWNHGFGILDCHPNKKDFEFRNYRIYRGRVL